MAERKFGRKKQRTSYDRNGVYRNKNQAVSAKVNDIIDMANYDTDPFGSYTGVPENRNEVPVQDADDL